MRTLINALESLERPSNRDTASRSESPPQSQTSKTSKRKSPKPTSYRQACTGRSRSLFISDYRDRQQAAILYTKTEQFALDMQFRSTIERIIAAFVRYNGARTAHSYGTDKADFQSRMAATAFNLKKWHKLMLDKEKLARYKPPDSS